jgi:hypothetical protein
VPARCRGPRGMAPAIAPAGGGRRARRGRSGRERQHGRSGRATWTARVCNPLLYPAPA